MTTNCFKGSSGCLLGKIESSDKYWLPVGNKKMSQIQITKKSLANHDNLCQGEVVVALWGSTTEGDGSRLPAFRFEMLWLWTKMF